jgi:hypothetical protein
VGGHIGSAIHATIAEALAGPAAFGIRGEGAEEAAMGCCSVTAFRRARMASSSDACGGVFIIGWVSSVVAESGVRGDGELRPCCGAVSRLLKIRDVLGVRRTEVLALLSLSGCTVSGIVGVGGRVSWTVGGGTKAGAAAMPSPTFMPLWNMALGRGTDGAPAFPNLLSIGRLEEDEGSSSSAKASTQSSTKTPASCGVSTS